MDGQSTIVCVSGRAIGPGMVAARRVGTGRRVRGPARGEVA